MNWQRMATDRIALINATLAADATLADRRKALREVAWQFHGGTSWGKKVWGKHCRAYLERHGQKPRLPVQDAASPMFADDISFPDHTPLATEKNEASKEGGCEHQTKPGPCSICGDMG